MEAVKDAIGWRTRWTLRKYLDDEAFKRLDAYEVSEFEGNVALTEGMAALCNLLIGAAETAFSQANSYVGVGDSNTAEDRSHTGLQAATNKLYKACDARYPTITDGGGGDAGKKIVTWRGVFGSTDANWAWEEFTVASGNSDAADNLNRKISSQGTKTSGQTWTLDVAVTIG